MEQYREERCLLCGSHDWVVRLCGPDFEVRRCGDCGLAWRRDRQAGLPAPHSAQLPEGAGFAAGSAGVEEIEEISRLCRPPGLLLNVGRDGANILETARLYGWNPALVDELEEVPEEEFAAFFRDPAGGLPPLPEYDVIRLQGALEQCRDPREYLSRADRWLGGRGLLVIGATDFRAWDFPLRGEGATLLDRDLPRWFFTPRTLEALLLQTGYHVVKVSSGRAPETDPGVRYWPLHDNGPEPRTGGLPPQPAAGTFRLYARRDEKRLPLARRSRDRQAQPWEAPNEELHPVPVTA